MKEAKFVEKLGSLIRVTQRGVQNAQRESSFGGHRHFPVPKPSSWGKYLPADPQPLPRGRSGCQVSPDGTVTQFSNSFFFMCE